MGWDGTVLRSCGWRASTRESLPWSARVSSQRPGARSNYVLRSRFEVRHDRAPWGSVDNVPSCGAYIAAYHQTSTRPSALLRPSELNLQKPDVLSGPRRITSPFLPPWSRSPLICPQPIAGCRPTAPRHCTRSHQPRPSASSKPATAYHSSTVLLQRTRRSSCTSPITLRFNCIPRAGVLRFPHTASAAQSMAF